MNNYIAGTEEYEKLLDTSIDYEKYPSLNPDSPFNKAHARKGYVIYHDGRRWPSFGYTITREGSYWTIASTMRQALRKIRKDKTKTVKPPYYESPIVYQEAITNDE